MSIILYISYEGSLPEIALSGASKLASTYSSIFYRSVHVLYTEITYNIVCLPVYRPVLDPVF